MGMNAVEASRRVVRNDDVFWTIIFVLPIAFEHDLFVALASSTFKQHRMFLFFETPKDDMCLVRIQACMCLKPFKIVSVNDGIPFATGLVSTKPVGIPENQGLFGLRQIVRIARAAYIDVSNYTLLIYIIIIIYSFLGVNLQYRKAK